MHLLGAVLAILSGATVALTNATGRRGVISGTPAQGMVISMPVGLASFLGFALLTGAVQHLGRFNSTALASLSAAGVLHFVLGRYCNFRASQAAGMNLTAPVVQLNSVVTLVFAVVILGEPCTMLQVIGAILMVAGSLLTQRSSEPATPSKLNEPAFKPRVAVGFLFALIAALAYGTSPIIVRQALQDVGALSGLAGGSVAYAAATVAVTVGLLIPSLRCNVLSVSRENARWFVYSGIFVAAAHGFLYSALAVAPIMLVAPLLQLSLVFRFLFALMLNPHHEVFGVVVVFRHSRFDPGRLRHRDRHEPHPCSARSPGTPRLPSALTAVSSVDHSPTHRRHMQNSDIHASLAAERLGRLRRRRGGPIGEALHALR